MRCAARPRRAARVRIPTRTRRGRTACAASGARAAWRLSCSIRNCVNRPRSPTSTTRRTAPAMAGGPCPRADSAGAADSRSKRRGSTQRRSAARDEIGSITVRVPLSLLHAQSESNILCIPALLLPLPEIARCYAPPTVPTDFPPPSCRRRCWLWAPSLRVCLRRPAPAQGVDPYRRSGPMPPSSSPPAPPSRFGLPERRPTGRRPDLHAASRLTHALPVLGAAPGSSSGAQGTRGRSGCTATSWSPVRSSIWSKRFRIHKLHMRFSRSAGVA